jgi:hypothetical protein
VHAPVWHPAHGTHVLPPGHCASAVHQQGTPAVVQVPPGAVTSLQLPAAHVVTLLLDGIWQLRES